MSESRALRTAPGALPLLGHSVKLIRDPLGFLESLPAHGGLVEIRLGPVPGYVVCHPALCHQVLVDDQTFDKGGPVIDAVRELVGDGLGTCAHTAHRRQRRLTQPAFHRRRFPGYTAVMADEVDSMTRSWREGERVELFEQLQRLTLRVVTRALFGSTQSPDQVRRISNDMAVAVGSLIWRIVLPRTFRVLPVPANRRYTEALARVHTFIDQMITDYRHGGVDHGDLLSMLLASRDDDGRGLSDAEVHDQVITFFVAGSETVAAALSWTIHLLGRHPEIEHQAAAEAQAVLSGHTASWEDLPRLPIIQRIVTETLRLYPPVWIMTRVVTADTELGGCAISAGSIIVISPYVLHRNSDIFAEPHRFDPGRWLGQGTNLRPNTGYVPFGGGARKCIGEAFSLTETVLVLASILNRWNLRPVPGIRVRLRPAPTLVPRSLAMLPISRNDRKRTEGGGW
ncbi:cytochrome P450 [Streptosporangium nondiastaticum]|nr:cytochrome P450 [Streptosporangium nondiastaticum]